MASLTIRRLDDDLKQRLRLRAAGNGRSMEDEVRTILRGAAGGKDTHANRAAPDRQGPAPQLVTKPRARAAAAEPKPGARRILLIIGGGIAAYKSLDLIRRLKERGALVRVVMTQAAQEFVTPLSAGAIAGGHVYVDLFDWRTEFDIGHIRLARDTDLVLVAPA